MKLKFSEILSRSFARTNFVLAENISFRKWLILAFIAYLAGSTSMNMNLGGSNDDKEPAPKSVTQTAPAAGIAAGSASDPIPPTAEDAETSNPPLKAPKRPFEMKDPLKAFRDSPGFVKGIIAGVIVMLLVLYLVLTWLSSRFKFVWFHAVVTGREGIGSPFARHREEGQSLFLGRVLVHATILASLAAPGIWLYRSAAQAGAFEPGYAWSFKQAIALFLPGFAVLVVLFFVWSAVLTAMEGLVVPVMALERLKIGPAASKVAAILRARIGSAFVFFLGTAFVNFAAGIFSVILLILILLVAVLLAVLVFGIFYVLFVYILKVMPVFVVIAVVLGIPYVLCVIAAMIFAQLPGAVFMRSFSIEYLLGMDAGVSQESLDAYTAVPETEGSKRWAIVPIVFFGLFMGIALIGLLAAIAIPNFVKARDAARAAQSSSAPAK